MHNLRRELPPPSGNDREIWGCFLHRLPNKIPTHANDPQKERNDRHNCNNANLKRRSASSTRSFSALLSPDPFPSLHPPSACLFSAAACFWKSSSPCHSLQPSCLSKVGAPVGLRLTDVCLGLSCKRSPSLPATPSVLLMVHNRFSSEIQSLHRQGRGNFRRYLYDTVTDDN